MKRSKRRSAPMMPLEPVEPSREEILARLQTISINAIDPDDRTDVATLDALRALGLRIVMSCQLCAEPQPPRIPACPNVATVTMQETRTGGFSSAGPVHVCQPHARGRRVYAGRQS
jgi:hypothetical protein